MENIEKEITSLVAKVIKCKEKDLDPAVDLFRDLGVDSLLGVEILANIDKKYGVEVPEERVRDIRTINDIISLVKEVLGKK